MFFFKIRVPYTQDTFYFYFIFSIKLKPSSIQGLFAFCSLGMLHSDLTLAELALKELEPHRDSPEYVSHIAVFRAYTHFLQVSSIIMLCVCGNPP